MNTEEKQRLQKIIRQKIQDLKQQVETFKNLSKPVSPDNAIGRLPRMEAINSKSINEASLEKQSKSWKYQNDLLMNRITLNSACAITVKNPFRLNSS